jgi:hypothetical protein
MSNHAFLICFEIKDIQCFTWGIVADAMLDFGKNRYKHKLDFSEKLDINIYDGKMLIDTLTFTQDQHKSYISIIRKIEEELMEQLSNHIPYCPRTHSIYVRGDSHSVEYGPQHYLENSTTGFFGCQLSENPDYCLIYYDTLSIFPDYSTDPPEHILQYDKHKWRWNQECDLNTFIKNIYNNISLKLDAELIPIFNKMFPTEARFSKYFNKHKNRIKINEMELWNGY